MRTSIAVAMVACLSVNVHASASQDGLPEADLRAIDEVSASLAKALLARDWKGVAALYVDDAVLYPPGETAVKGRPAIEACLAGLPPMKDFKLRTTKVEGRADLAYVQGTYMMTVPAADSPESAQHSGYFLQVRRKQPDGRWLIAVEMMSPHQ